ncbi:hypothetical protein JZ751_007000 [Albula glossodonta]|uniref:Stimulator of interferon genes protein n=1 Tax=Albula glossodonta TaxID=121402 RepID=A0A8T2PAZ7_9TELE|nr:hypothetical protein JZ751_007000 [Albula glossodonta]
MNHPSRGSQVIPRPRGRLPLFCTWVMTAVILSMAYLLMGHMQFCRQAALAALGLGLGAMLQGLCLLPEECLHHFVTRYNGHLPYMLRDCFRSTPSLVLVVVVLVLWAGFLPLKIEEYYTVAVNCGFSLLLKACGVLGPAPVEIQQICEQQKMNVAHGLAWSFYTGYLKLVLPSLQDAKIFRMAIRSYEAGHRPPERHTKPIKNEKPNSLLPMPKERWLENSIKQYRDQHNSNILRHRDSWRLHILVPLSAFIPDKIEEADRNVHFLHNLPEIVINRAGVRNRVYKHSMYEVLDHLRQPHHCVVEYATPLQTLYQMSQDSSAGLSAEDRRQQVLLFCRTLQSILEESLECRNRYRLIILDDDQEAEQDSHFLSKEILKQLQQEEKEEYSLAPPEEAALNANIGPQVAFMSRAPTLMISNDMSENDLPSPLKEPVETTDLSYVLPWGR